MPRAAVFIDYQNVYRSAREAFGWEAEGGHFGNFRPLALARLLTQDGNRELVRAAVYTGMPVPERDRKGHAAMQRRTQAWVSEDPGIVKLHERALKYPPAQGREKGIDVQVALDFVSLALDDEYDIGILVSADSDLAPALEFVARRCPDKQIETVAVEPLPGFDTGAPIDIPGGGAVRRLLTKDQFDRIADKTNYLNPPQQKFAGQRPGETPGQSGRRLPPGRRTGL